MVRRVWRFLLPADNGIGGLICPCLVAWSPWFVFLLYTYDYLYYLVLKILSSFVRDSSDHDIPKATAVRYICYVISTYMGYRACTYNYCNLEDCIRKGDGTPVQLEDLECFGNMEGYRQSMPAFRYNAVVFPPYGDTKHHWFISTPYNHVSLITDSKQEIFNYING